MSKTRRIIIGLIVLFSLAGIGWLTSARWLPGVAGWLDVGEEPNRVNYVMAMPGDENYRPFVAAALINAGFADQALIVQNEISPAELDGVAISSSEITKRVYRHRGIPETKLLILSGRSASTAGDIDALASFLGNHPRATVAIVTSDYHTRRSRMALRHQLGPIAEQLVILSAPNGGFDRSCWWQIEDGFVAVMTEYLKLLAYILLYGRFIWWFLLTVTALAFTYWVYRVKSSFNRTPS